LNSRADDGQTGERALIQHIRRRLPAAPPSLLIGPGDDAAVLTPTRGALQVLTTDALVEGVHFDRRFSSLSDIGYKAVAVNVSDIAAMGATPEFVLLSLILPDGFSRPELDQLLDGVLEMAAKAQAAVAGGNISRSPGPLIVDVTATGSVRPRRILTRAGGCAGDFIYVTGSIGGAAAGLAALKSGTISLEGAATAGPLAGPVRRHQRPEPRLRMGSLLGRNRAASACMDLSDGLADAVRQIAEASGTGATIDASLLPIDPAASGWFEGQGLDPVLSALTGGDDYELLFTVSKKLRGRFRGVQTHAQGLPVTRIGELTQAGGLRLSRGGGFEPIPEGFTHF
jgi:thiamine-monophosphate kinase